jgi:hypothetical protein
MINPFASAGYSAEKTSIIKTRKTFMDKRQSLRRRFNSFERAFAGRR